MALKRRTERRPEAVYRTKYPEMWGIPTNKEYPHVDEVQPVGQPTSGFDPFLAWTLYVQFWLKVWRQLA